MTNLLKLIACITMLIDHIGMVFYPDIIWFRIIGRVAMPAFAYMIVMSWKNTSDRKKYIKTLFIIALLSQIPYVLLIDSKLNIIWTFIITLLTISAIENTKSKIVKIIYFLISIIIPSLLGISYGCYPVLLIYMFNRHYEKTKTLALYFIIISLMALEFNSVIELISIPLVCLFENLYKIRINMHKKVLNAFYPVHLLILCITNVVI